MGFSFWEKRRFIFLKKRVHVNPLKPPGYGPVYVKLVTKAGRLEYSSTTFTRLETQATGSHWNLLGTCQPHS